MPIHFDDTVPPNILITITGKVDAEEYDSYHDVLRKRMLAARAARVAAPRALDLHGARAPRGYCADMQNCPRLVVTHVVSRKLQSASLAHDSLSIQTPLSGRSMSKQKNPGA